MPLQLKKQEDAALDRPLSTTSAKSKFEHSSCPVISVPNMNTLPVGTLTLRRLWLEGCVLNGTVGLILGAGD